MQTTPNEIPANYYEAKKIVSQLGFKEVKIDCCVNGCMIYYKEDKDLRQCKFCGEQRFKPRKGKNKEVSYKRMHYLPLIPRLQRLYASMSTAPHMLWHHQNRRNDDVMTHPSHGEAWKHFDTNHPHFASEPRNVKLGLCSDGFSPNVHFSTPYSCWPVIVTPYNLPPHMCMKDPFLFLTCIIPGKENPKAKIDVHLQPLIDELKELWDEGVLTYDIHSKRNFQLKAALMWTINDFPAYGMLSGWSTGGRLACPVCMEDTKAFWLDYGGKNSWFDCHRRYLPEGHPYRRNKVGFKKNVEEDEGPPIRLSGEQIWERVRHYPKIVDTGGQVRLTGYGVEHNWTKRSIFWDLSYWKDHLVRHCLDLMHIEKNFFDNIMNTVMDTERTKDNEKARLDMAVLCKRPDLNLVQVREGHWAKPKGNYVLTLQQRKNVCKWVQELKMPDGYVSNLQRCVDVKGGKLFGMKTHDCHVFMECLLPLAFKELPDHVWKPLTEISQYFRDLCSSTLRVSDLVQMEVNIPVILCKLERIFPPAFFDVMEHLPVHLAYEARVCGPAQYRWMYPFEREIGTYKISVKNRARVEGSICQAYLARETSSYCSYYFEPHVMSKRTRPNRNDDSGVSSSEPTLSIFDQPGIAGGANKDRWLTSMEMKAAHLHILLNCPEVDTFRSQYEHIHGSNNSLSNFPSWFREHVKNPSNDITCPHLLSLAFGPKTRATSVGMFKVNGYRFHTPEHASGKKTDDTGIYVKGDGGNDASDWYGTLKEILIVEYPSLVSLRVTLFYCEWYDPTRPRGTRRHKDYKIIEVLPTRRYGSYDPFILAQKARQVYYMPYPQGCKSNWKVVITCKP
ncbi:uncharacterized protein [Arachis hypogaea]|uniref:uncharacterized protein n=1 Tax=Arachis hypogaea TaxID=3818 RepID=UPI000DEC8170|nr:uncharacterized protein LOC112749133 [Arachis hypogaea]